MEPGKLGKKISWNTLMGILFKVLTLVLAFVSRSVFILFLNEEYLGINGLYSNILSVLSMADLGINAVMIYVLYEPLVNENKERMAALVRLFKKLYNLIAGAIFLLGVLLVPMLPYIVSKNTLGYADLVKYYLLFLLNTVCSYLGAYKSTLLVADQKGYYVNIALFASNVVRLIGQIVLLYITHNYTLYLVVMILGTVLNNAILAWIANRYYPVLKRRDITVDVSDVKPTLIEKTKAVFLYRMGGTLMDSTDNVLISILLGTLVVGYYSNYSMITLNVFSMLGVMSQACMTGVGNFSVNAAKNDKKSVYYTMTLLYFFLGALVFSGMLCAMNDFMWIWLRQERYILSQGFVLVLAIRLFMDIILSANWVFREAQGMFNEAKNIRLWGAGLNVILSIVMGKLWGLSGIIGATAISKLMTTFWYEPKTICNKVFNESTKEYWKLWVKMMVTTAVAVVVSYAAAFWLADRISTPVIKILTKAAICVIVVTCVFAGAVFSESRFNNIAHKIKGVLRIKR